MLTIYVNHVFSISKLILNQVIPKFVILWKMMESNISQVIWGRDHLKKREKYLRRVANLFMSEPESFFEFMYTFVFKKYHFFFNLITLNTFIKKAQMLGFFIYKTNQIDFKLDSLLLTQVYDCKFINGHYFISLFYCGNLL